MKKIIGWYNKFNNHFFCLDCFSKTEKLDEKNCKPIRKIDLEKDIYTCDKCGKKFELNDKTKVKENGAKKIKEIKCTCESCGNIWFYGKEDVSESKANAAGNLGKAFMCCGGCWPALLIPEGKVIDFNKCPKCGSRAAKKEIIVHNV